MSVRLAHWIIRVRSPSELVSRDRGTGARVTATRQLFHGYATINRANADTQVTANAFRVDDLEAARAIDKIGDGLMRRVFTDNVAASALNAEVLVDDSLLDMVEIEMLPVSDARDSFANELLQADVLVIKKVAQAVRQVINNLESVNHRSSTNLHVARAESEKVDSITPIRNTADTGNWYVGRLRSARNLGDHIERNRLNGFTAVTAVCSHAIGRREHRQGVIVHPHDGIDRVDE